MRYIVFSDSHGNKNSIYNALCENEHVISGVIFLGDGLRDFDRVIEGFPGLTVHRVRGNCDYAFASDPEEDFIMASGKKIGILHGHTRGVKSGLNGLKAFMSEMGCDAVLFGHTHSPMLEYLPQGGLILNPGPALYGYYCLMDIDSEITARLMSI